MARKKRDNVSSDSDDDGEAEYQVESIRERRVKKGRVSKGDFSPSFLEMFDFFVANFPFYRLSIISNGKGTQRMRIRGNPLIISIVRN